MAIQKWFVKKGYVFPLRNQTNGASNNEDNGFDLLKWLKGVLLNNINVPYFDNCCDAGSTTLPTRFNATTQKIEYFNGTAWTKVPSTSIT